MTQFFLIESSAPYSAFPDLAFSDVENDSFLAESASIVFTPPVGVVWSVSPPQHEVGALAYQARDALLRGERLTDTRLGKLVAYALSQNHRFCMFYASDRTDLPTPTAAHALFAELTQQLRRPPDSNLELYVQWSGAA